MCTESQIAPLPCMVRTSQGLPEIIPAALHLETEIGVMHFCLLLVRMRTEILYNVAAQWPHLGK